MVDKVEQLIEQAWKIGRRRLDLSRSGLTEVPESLGRLTALTTLSLAGNQLTALPEWLGNLTALTRLYLSDNQLTAPPQWLGNLTALTTLDLARNQLTALPESLGNLTTLTTLDLSYNQLTAPPESLGNLTALTTLDLSDNQLTALPESLSNLTALTTLYLYNNQLTALPEWLGNLTALTTLSLARNQLTALPEWLGELTALTTLYLSDNQLTALPEWLGELTALTTLDPSNNQLTTLPESLGNLTALTTLDLSGNPLAPEIAAAHREGWQELKSLLRLLNSEGVAIREAKLVLVGEGKAGKSSLLAAMCDEPWVENRPTTHGIDIKPVTVHDSTGVSTTLNGWDFGGQPDYRPTHQLFFTAPAVYLLVWNPRLGPQVSFVEFWIEQIQYRAGDDARIHVVATHAGPGERGAWIDEAGLQERFGDMIAGFHHVDSCTRLGVPELMTAIANTVSTEIPHVQRRYPASWLRLQTTLRDSGAPYLSYTDFQQIAIAEGLSATSARSLAINANALGHWIFYSADPALADLVVLKPDWLSTAISFILEDPETRASKGLLAHRRLTHLWNDPIRPQTQRYPTEVHPTLLQLMEKFDISYRVAPSTPQDEPTSLIAQLVATIRPATVSQAWDGYAPNLAERVQVCEIVDSSGAAVTALTGLVYQLIVRFHRFSLGRYNYQDSVHWQHGMIADNGYHGRALIIADRSRITVRVRAAYPQGLLDRLTDDITEYITGFWPGLNVRVLVACGKTCLANRPGSGLFNVEELTLTAAQGINKAICSTCKQFPTIDSLLAGVTVPVTSDEQRLARVVSAATASALDHLAAILADNTATVVQVIKNQTSRVLDTLAVQQAEVAAAISQTEQHLRDLLLALDDEARDGPTLFTVTRLPRSVTHPDLTTRRLRVTLWCEHSRLPVHLLNPPTGPTGVYDLALSRDWVVKAAPVLKTASILLRILLPASAAAIGPAFPDPDRWKALGEQLHLAEESLDGLTDAADDLTATARKPRPPVHPISLDGPLQLDSSLIRVLRTHIAKIDPSFAGLTRVTVRTRHLWIHPQFEHYYYSPPPTIPNDQ